MATLGFELYNGYQILNIEPIGDGGVALNTNFMKIANFEVSTEAHILATTGVHGATPINIPNRIVQRDSSGGIAVGAIEATFLTANGINVGSGPIYAGSITSNISTQKLNISLDGTILGTRQTVNFETTSGFTYDIADDPVHDRVNIQLLGISGYSGTGGNGSSGYSGYSGVGIAGTSGFSAYSGYSGKSGQSGFSGIIGASGISGQSGQAGSNGISGFSGYSGYSGSSGQSGDAGTLGASGASGFSGYSGLSGRSGTVATRGSPGSVESLGSQGRTDTPA